MSVCLLDSEETRQNVVVCCKEFENRKTWDVYRKTVGGIFVLYKYERWNVIGSQFYWNCAGERFPIETLHTKPKTIVSFYRIPSSEMVSGVISFVSMEQCNKSILVDKDYDSTWCKKRGAELLINIFTIYDCV